MSNVLVSAYRWQTIVETGTKLKVSYLKYLKFTWIGLLFNSVLPGAVSGDFIKLIYARDLDRNLSKTFLLTSIMMDRILGLCGLLCILGFSTILSYQEMINISPKIKPLLQFNFMIFLGICCFITYLFLPKRLQKPLVSLSEKVPTLGQYISKVLREVWVIGGNKKVVLIAILLSTITQFLNITAFWTLASPFFDTQVPMRFAYAFIPIGLMSIAIPISPAGLGVGHAMFGILFNFFGVTKGASLFNFHFLATVIVNCFGVFPYAFSKGPRHKASEIATIES